MPNEPDNNTTIQDRYAAQFAADLDRNTKEQGSVSAKIAELQARLEQLKAEHAWLSNAQGRAAEEPTAAEQVAQSPDGNAEATPAQTAAPQAAVPQQRQAGKATSESGRSRKKTARTAKKAQPAGKKDGPTLREVVLSSLTLHHQPRMVSEVVNELTEAHPERPTSAPVVRNTLEALVAKGQVERRRQLGSVFYTALRTGAGPEAAPEAAPEAVEEKVAAEV